MALANYAALQAALVKSRTNFWLDAQDRSSTSSTDEVTLSSYALDGGSHHALGDELAAPTTAVSLSYSTDPLWSFPHPVGSAVHVTQVRCGADSDSGRAAGILIDRLGHTGGLSGTVATAQTTNLPTAALPTRATGGAGVMAALQIYTTLGATNANVTCSYTNQSGTAARTGTAEFVITPISTLVYPFTLEGADSGVRSVESVTLSVSTGTVGDFGVLLYKPLMVVSPGSGAMIATPTDGLVRWNNPIEAEAVLEFLYDGAVAPPDETSTLFHYANF